jgi:NtrC-family two-component system sensor histidine kinase KinB
MLSIFQRLLLGGLLLFALVTGLSFLVRGSFVALSTLDGEQKRMDGATAAVAAAQGSVAREQILVERSLLHLPPRVRATSRPRASTLRTGCC